MGDVVQVPPSVSRKTLVDASYKVNELAKAVPRKSHGGDCPKRYYQTDEFACTCWVTRYYRSVLKTLEDAAEELERLRG